MFKQLIKLAFGCAAIAVTLFLLAMQFGWPPWVVLFLSGISGFFLLALLPMCVELGVEVTYPATEGVVTGALLLIGNFYGLIFFFILQILIKDEDSDGDLDSTLSLWVLLGICWICCLGSVFIYGDYKRLDFERQEKGEEFGQAGDPNSGIQSQYAGDSLSDHEY
eukprot:CAMPEP_0201510002 /NCGR_PEP_ID=MMETSP0161_2-20130828/2878_1 /ASSEMBLY_ACC=CAM_ASM_000251 /TAXON_ID=180227 /ORGANISM="Neoparamoeba aestuarina, Strain SoJaBio B1-5/56/2" /LENGTH=164 /DNA_ID=CAMNT_0047905113 /DNA_START=862 /DNA_END=1356 /DNA_ORIENTATION=-